MYPSGWPDVVQIDDLSLKYTKSTENILKSLERASSADSTLGWIVVVAYALDDASQDALIKEVEERRISGLALMVLANRICEKALGITLTAASSLAGTLLASWFSIAAWASGRGLVISNMKIHDLLAVCYYMQLDQCKEDRDIASLNRSVFGSSRPWRR